MRRVKQDILRGGNYPSIIDATRVSANEAALKLLQPSTDGIMPIGIAYQLSSKGCADYICLANETEVFIVSLTSKAKGGLTNEFATLLHAGGATDASKKNPCLVGFSMARIATHVNKTTRLDMRGVDLSTLLSPNAHDPWPPSAIASKLEAGVNTRAIASLWIDSKEKDVVLQAWLAACVAHKCKPALEDADRLDTQHLTTTERTCLGQLVTEADLLDRIKPTEVQSDFSEAKFNRQGHLQVLNSRYKTRVRIDSQTHVILTDVNGNKATGRTKRVKGKTATIALPNKQKPNGVIQNITVIGRPNLTNPEKARDELLLMILTKRKRLSDSLFIRLLWFPKRLKKAPKKALTFDVGSQDRLAEVGLNGSQLTAARAMLGNLPIVIVHGPPGTGKTSTIAAASGMWDQDKCPAWIVAHSNVAVKNIAESFCRKKINFKLIVSKEFYEEWHEHIYKEVEANLIRTDELPEEKVGMERLISGSTIILCTLSTLSNPSLHFNGTFEIVPPKFLVIDEASQISLFEFMHVFEKFRVTLKKVCFFGDPKQLPPYGRESVPSMKTIFDLAHLQGKGCDHFLNIQYRMPIPIAAFISRHVYNGRLNSQHEISGPSCLALIDVPQTGEESVGSSSRNTGEINTIIHLVKSYYRHLDFCVITPYDAQRNSVQSSLEDENLPSDSVYNVDSFQGNEADFVIVSVVRSSRVGFLQSVNRMNVMLTRCRKGLIIVSSQEFLGTNGKGASTLLGKLVKEWKTQYPAQSWINWRSVAEGSVDLPGVTAPKRPRVTLPTGNC